MAEITLVEDVNLALAHEMQTDERVVILGEDVGVNGGVFRATVGLQERFGEERVLDTPLSEALIAGMAIGMAAQGLRPVAEVQFMGFIYPTIDQILNHAARLRTRTRGRLTSPLVLRAPFGGGIHAPEHHSESTEARFAHIPGLRVVIPSSPLRAYGLLLAAIRDPDPVVFLEPKRIYRIATQDIEDDADIETWVNGGDIMMRLIHAIAAGCRAEPALNAWYDSHSLGRRLIPQIHLGVAVDTGDGLFVPVLRDVGNKEAGALRNELDALKEQVRSRKIPPVALRGQTFTLSNFGTFAGRYANPLILPPTVAILGAGKVRPEVVATGTGPAIHHMLPLSLSFDHRAVTGGEASRFLGVVIEDLQQAD